MNSDLIAYISTGFTLVLAGIGIFLCNRCANLRADAERIDFLQARGLRIARVDDKFGVIQDGVVIGIGFTGNLREAIDGARAHIDALEEV